MHRKPAYHLLTDELLAAHSGNVAAVARHLGVSLPTCRAWCTEKKLLPPVAHSARSRFSLLTREMYDEEHGDLKAIALRLGIAFTTARAWCIDCGFATSSTGSILWHLTPETVETALRRHRTIREAADSLGVSRQALSVARGRAGLRHVVLGSDLDAEAAERRREGVRRLRDGLRLKEARSDVVVRRVDELVREGVRVECNGVALAASGLEWQDGAGFRGVDGSVVRVEDIVEFRIVRTVAIPTIKVINDH